MECGRVKVDQQKQYDFEIPRYTEERFSDVSEKVLPKLSSSLARYIGANVWKMKGDIRDVIAALLI